MLQEVVETSPENDVARGLNYRETELTLGLPGESRPKLGTKRVFSETVGLSLGVSKFDDESGEKCSKKDLAEDEIISEAAAKSPKAKNQVVGWPPVRSFRQNMIKPKKFVKVAVDGAPYLRKVDLETYNSYQQLLRALGEMFMTCFAICDSRLIDPANGSEYVPTYEDKDGDWMLVGDVPWKMFVDSCKRVRIMKSSEVTGLAPKSSISSSSRS